MTNTIDLLKQTTAGLMMPSESEYPFDVFSWESFPLNETTVLEKAGQSQDTQVKIVGIDDFFRVATTEEDWHKTEEKETVRKFQTLVNTLKTNLNNLQVYKIGSKEIDVYIIGATPDGIAGISTKVIET
ncbi:nuclease A inhibitor family protein [Sphaerospermopsis sp. FACHB-1094]|uniref:nuclease A inhibitor family protein n=1 Tax=Sphaerospermopsis sp. FACHB-1094 TaxID=2692861 RepID=UPI0016832FE7|nr:nuclease A inhibitor family protein [Sphaerospermopsis sp. FACHB-1094]MBD2132606.1 nuclease A inhibitor family protein [Sphaerospermopsis sp. FACHB-1094]